MSISVRSVIQKTFTRVCEHIYGVIYADSSHAKDLDYPDLLVAISSIFDESILLKPVLFILRSLRICWAHENQNGPSACEIKLAAMALHSWCSTSKKIGSNDVNILLMLELIFTMKLDDADFSRNEETFKKEDLVDISFKPSESTHNILSEQISEAIQSTSGANTISGSGSGSSDEESSNTDIPIESPGLDAAAPEYVPDKDIGFIGLDIARAERSGHLYSGTLLEIKSTELWKEKIKGRHVLILDGVHAGKVFIFKRWNGTVAQLFNPKDKIIVTIRMHKSIAILNRNIGHR